MVSFLSLKSGKLGLNIECSSQTFDIPKSSIILVFISIYIYYYIHSHISLLTVYDRPYNINEGIELGTTGLFNLGKDLSIFSIYE